MQGAHERFFEISRLIQGDPEGGHLMEDVLNTCCDYSLAGPDLISGLGRDRAGQLVDVTAALQRFNRYLAGRYPSFADGLFQGSPQEVSSWSDALTYQILANRPN